MDIDVIVLTKNSEYILERSLNSIYENVPVKDLIVVDGFSTDNTLKIIDSFQKKYHNINLIKKRGTRATARELGIEFVETKWFLFVDSDIVLCKDWYDKASKHLRNKVGAIWGLNIDIVPNFHNRHFYKLLMYISKEAFKIRGGMHDTLIRRDAVKDIHIPKKLHTYEDAFIIKWIKDAGYDVVIGEEIYCLHLRPPSDYKIRQSVSLGYCEFKNGLIDSKAFKYALTYPFFYLNWLVQNLQDLHQKKCVRSALG
jgi:glycosyltransferase involved in cell wall biosynthesis